MIWTKEQPTVSGFWWLRASPQLTPIVVYVDVYKEDIGKLLKISFTGFADTWTQFNVEGAEWSEEPVSEPWHEEEEIKPALAFLKAAELMYDKEEDCPDGDRILNMNDTWGWATGWGEKIPVEALPEVHRLVRQYGYCGALYWVSERHEHMRSEFADINRFVEFVRAEEAIRAEFPNSSKRAYVKKIYTVGEVPK